MRLTTYAEPNSASGNAFGSTSKSKKRRQRKQRHQHQELQATKDRMAAVKVISPSPPPAAHLEAKWKQRTEDTTKTHVNVIRNNPELEQLVIGSSMIERFYTTGKKTPAHIRAAQSFLGRNWR